MPYKTLTPKVYIGVTKANLYNDVIYKYMEQ